MLAHSASHATFSSTTAGSIALLLLLLRFGDGFGGALDAHRPAHPLTHLSEHSRLSFREAAAREQPPSTSLPG